MPSPWRHMAPGAQVNCYGQSEEGMIILESPECHRPGSNFGSWQDRNLYEVGWRRGLRTSWYIAPWERYIYYRRLGYKQINSRDMTFYRPDVCPKRSHKIMRIIQTALSDMYKVTNLSNSDRWTLSHHSTSPPNPTPSQTFFDHAI